ncbi:amidohydrolase family protein [Flagellimonas algicola]|uniref:Amidohydrolase family protein n=1 Tax=Flagellimonas algicola TaxID=2583815 RepID=A0ABY2WJT5_9FLAO|nr:amidohydrolase family protein [Allomuricauda algicola]TMU55104.1 amidohydrolase family protein [Allomuricauda algicola]
MKNLLRWILFPVLLACNSTPSDELDLIISNVNLIDGTGMPVQTVSIGIKNGKISAIEPSISIARAITIDGSRKYLIPGLFDCHVHTSNFERDFPRLVHYGITSIFIPGGGTTTNQYFKAMRERGNKDTIPAPYVFHTSQHFSMEGCHPTKTYPSPVWREGETIFYLKDTLQIEKLVKQVAQYPIQGIKLTIEDGPAPPFVERIPQEFINKVTKEASKHGLEIFAHVSDNKELEMAITGGIQNLVHFTGVNIDQQDKRQLELLKQFKQREPHWVTTLMIDKSFLYPLHPEWFEVEAMLPAYRDKVQELTPMQVKLGNMYVSNLMEEYGLTENSLSAFVVPQVEDIKFLRELGINMVLGTDAGNKFNFHGYSLHEEMQLFELGGMEPLEIIKMGTLNAAKMVNAQDSLGSIEVGKIANMVLLNKSPLVSINNTLEINTVIKKGVVQKRLGE